VGRTVYRCRLRVEVLNGACELEGRILSIIFSIFAGSLSDYCPVVECLSDAGCSREFGCRSVIACSDAAEVLESAELALDRVVVAVEEGRGAVFPVLA